MSFLANLFRKDPANVAARQQGKTERARLQNENRADRRDHGTGLSGTDAANAVLAFHGQSNNSAEKFWGVADGGDNWLGQIFGAGVGGGNKGTGVVSGPHFPTVGGAVNSVAAAVGLPSTGDPGAPDYTETYLGIGAGLAMVAAGGLALLATR